MGSKEHILNCVHDRRKSFYKKATYLEHETKIYKYYTLYSYKTPVLKIAINKNNVLNSYFCINNFELYSRTTWRHVWEFILQFLPEKTSAFEKENLNSKTLKKFAKKMEF